jgi:hypothetical protein
MGLTLSQTALWYSAVVLEVLLCALAVRRRLYARLPILTTYFFLLILRATFIYAVYASLGYRTRFALYSYWLSEGILLAARAAAIGELAWNASRAYAGLRAILRWIFAGIVCVLLVQASIAASTHVSRLPHFILTLEQSLELTAAVALILLLAVTRFYNVSWDGLETGLAAGLLFYSLVQVANNAISKYGLESHFHWWEGVRSTSFCVALLIWLIALAKPIPKQADEPIPELNQARALMREGRRTLTDLLERVHGVKRT